MATPKRFGITLYPGILNDGFMQIDSTNMQRLGVHQACNVKELETTLRNIAKHYGGHCHLSIVTPDGQRAMPGQKDLISRYEWLTVDKIAALA